MVLFLPLWHKGSNNTMHLQSKLNARTLRNEHMFALNVIFTAVLCVRTWSGTWNRTYAGAGRVTSGVVWWYNALIDARHCTRNCCHAWIDRLYKIAVRRPRGSIWISLGAFCAFRSPYYTVPPTYLELQPACLRCRREHGHAVPHEIVT